VLFPVSASGDLDIIVGADVLYDGEKITRPQRLTSMVLVADSKAEDLRGGPYGAIDQDEAATWPDLEELDEFRKAITFEPKWSKTTS
jgi:hypothetical protein